MAASTTTAPQQAQVIAHAINFSGTPDIDHIVYKGVFLDSDQSGLLRDRIETLRTDRGTEELARPTADLHVTTGFGEEAQNAMLGLIGEPVLMEVTGYANNGKNEGIEVQPVFSDRAIMDEMEGRAEIAPLHITLSIDEGAKAVDTGSLSFEPLAEDERFMITGDYGVFATVEERDTVDTGTEAAAGGDLEIAVAYQDLTDGEKMNILDEWQKQMEWIADDVGERITGGEASRLQDLVEVNILESHGVDVEATKERLEDGKTLSGMLSEDYDTFSERMEEIKEEIEEKYRQEMVEADEPEDPELTDMEEQYADTFAYKEMVLEEIEDMEGFHLDPEDLMEIEFLDIRETDSTETDVDNTPDQGESDGIEMEEPDIEADLLSIQEDIVIEVDKEKGEESKGEPVSYGDILEKIEQNGKTGEFGGSEDRIESDTMPNAYIEVSYKEDGSATIDLSDRATSYTEEHVAYSPDRGYEYVTSYPAEDTVAIQSMEPEDVEREMSSEIPEKDAYLAEPEPDPVDSGV